MAGNPNASKAANIQNLAVPPIPRLQIPPLPEKLRRIDPNGADQFQQQLQRAHDDWVQQLNTVGFITQSQVQTLVRKG